MASKLKQNKPEVILQAVAHSAENTNVTSANIYQYDVEKPPTEGIKIYNKNLVIRPWLLFIAINLIALLVFGAIGYGIGIGISSAYPKLHGDFCNSTNECSQSDNLLCVDLTCTCPTTKYFNGLTCVDRLSYGAVCTNFYQNECAYGLGCFYNGEKRTGICDCSTERFWDTRTNYCELKYSYNQNGCTNSEQCANGANMICSSSVCTCDSSNFWNGTQCGPIATYMQNCSIQTNCDSTKSLVCSMVGENLYKCLCSATDYWSSTTCTAKLGYSIGCSDDGQCREDLGLTCSGTCSCLNTHYWDSTICQRKKQNGIACASPSECDDNIGLTVCSVTCNCPSLYFYNGTACQFDLVSGLNCDSSFDCDTTKGLLCDAATKQCVCPVNEFWDYTTCVAKRTSGQDCVHDIQCRDDLGLSCDIDNTKKCICLSTHYWTSSICSSKVSEGVSCSSNPNCQDYNGLECSAGPGPVCRCPTNYYWNNTLCVIQLLFDEPCSGALSGIMCMTTKGLACDGTTNTCRCSSAANYWDSTDCVAKLDYDVSCQFQVTTLTNPQCDERSPKFLICRAIDFATNNFRCRCPSDRRWDSASTSCIVKNTYKGTCASGQDYECQDYNGLICNTANNTCLCPVTKYWDTTDTICKDKLPIHSPCDFPAATDQEQCQDYAWLYCNSALFGTCQCSPDRYYNTAFMACLPRASHNQYCGDGTLCMPSTPRELTCSAAAEDTCQCENYRNIDSPYYWSPSEKNCRTCPNGYLSGYGYNIQNSLNSITSRCYRVEYSSTLSYSAALASCTANAAHLMNIRNSMEMGVAAYWSSGTRSFWVGATALSTANTFTWRNWLSTTVDADLWCRGEPTGGGVGWGAYIHGDRGDCLDQAAVTTNLYFICEYSV